MKIHVKKGQEFKKGGFMSGKNVKLTLEVHVSLSEQDNQLIDMYHEPAVSIFEIQACYDGTEEKFKAVKVKSIVNKLSKFHLNAYVDSGDMLGNMQKFEKAVIAALIYGHEHLVALEQWEGESILAIKEESEEDSQD